MGAERPSPPGGAVAWTRGRVYAWTRGRVDTSTDPFFFLLDKSRKLSKIVSVLQSASVERFNVSRMRDFLVIGPPLTVHLHSYSSHHPGIIFETFTRFNPQVNHEHSVQVKKDQHVFSHFTGDFSNPTHNPNL